MPDNESVTKEFCEMRTQDLKASLVQDKLYYEKQFEEIRVGLKEIKGLLNPKIEQVIAHEEWIKNHDGKREWSLKTWALLLTGIFGVIQLLFKLIETKF